jgi:hypothetical protein
VDFVALGIIVKLYQGLVHLYQHSIFALLENFVLQEAFKRPFVQSVNTIHSVDSHLVYLVLKAIIVHLQDYKIWLNVSQEITAQQVHQLRQHAQPVLLEISMSELLYLIVLLVSQENTAQEVRLYQMDFVMQAIIVKHQLHLLLLLIPFPTLDRALQVVIAPLELLTRFLALQGHSFQQLELLFLLNAYNALQDLTGTKTKYPTTFCGAG